METEENWQMTKNEWTGKQCYKDLLLCSETYWHNWPALRLPSVSFLLLQLDHEDSASLVASIKSREENDNKDGDNDQDCNVHTVFGQQFTLPVSMHT